MPHNTATAAARLSVAPMMDCIDLPKNQLQFSSLKVFKFPVLAHVGQYRIGT